MNKEVADTPKISVLMPIYNGERHLAEAIDSILKQTYKSFELLLLIEYGSSEESKRIAKSFNDERIRIIENSERLGLPESLNVGIRSAKGEYIARMDADDIAYRNRFKEQVKFLENRSEVDLVGTNALINGKIYKRTCLPTKYKEIKFLLCLRSSLMHPSVMWRKEKFVNDNLYYNNIPHSEDYELWTRVIHCHRAENLRKPLFSYRVDGTGKGATTNWEEATWEIRNKMIRSLGIDFDLIENFYDKSKNEDIFIKKIDCLKQIGKVLGIDDIKKIYTEELCKIFINNGYSNFGYFWTLLNCVYKKEDLITVRYRFYRTVFIEKIKNIIAIINN